MDAEIFRAGVSPGGPTTGDEIKILICYILTETNGKMSFAQLHEGLSEHGLVNYFELVPAIDSLLHTGHIAQNTQEPPLYAVTKLGREAAKTVQTLVPKSVRDKALASAGLLLKRRQRESEIRIEIVPQNDGFEARLSLPGAGSNLLSCAVFCPTRDEAELVRKRFLNDPAYIYKGVMALLTGDREVLGQMFPERERLF